MLSGYTSKVIVTRYTGSEEECEMTDVVKATLAEDTGQAIW